MPKMNELLYTKYFNEVILYERMKIENMKEYFSVFFRIGLYFGEI